MKVDLLETSAVGIGAYPFAHNSFDPNSFDLLKALHTLSLSTERRGVDHIAKMSEEEKKTEDTSSESSEGTEEKKEGAEEKSEESSEGSDATEEKSVTVALTKDDIKDMMTGIVKEALTAKRGLVDAGTPEEKARKIVKDAELGELFLAMAAPKAG